MAKQVEKPCPNSLCQSGLRVVAVITVGDVKVPVPAPCPVCSGHGTIFVNEGK